MSVFHQLFAGKIWQPPTTGTFAGLARPASLTARALSDDGTLPPAHEQSIETASTDVNKRRIASPPAVILRLRTHIVILSPPQCHPEPTHIVILSAVEGRQCGEAG
jgi:hypothetical protein